MSVDAVTSCVNIGRKNVAREVTEISTEKGFHIMHKVIVRNVQTQLLLE